MNSSSVDTSSAPSSWRRLIRNPRFSALVIAGLLLLAGSFLVRLLDRPKEFNELDWENGSFFTQSFSAGIDQGGFQNLTCQPRCPLTLSFKIAENDPQIIEGTFFGSLQGSQKASAPARLVILTPQGTEGFSLDPASISSATLAVDNAPVPADALGHPVGGHSVMATISIPRLDPDSPNWILVTFRWHAGDAFQASGIGRRNLRIAYFPSSLILRDAKVLRLYEPGKFDQSLNQLAIFAEVDKKNRIATTQPDPFTRPGPNSVEWMSPLHARGVYYLLTIEKKEVRFWINIVNEQTLFASGLLLGAAIGAIAADWLARRARRVP